jgi:23S rRNA (adenine2030-N6)-methyltransferase
MLVDPPFERTDEYDAMLASLREAHRKWPTGIYALWHPIKDVAATSAFMNALKSSGIKRILRLALSVGGETDRLTQTGLVVVNPPFVFEDEARTILAYLSRRLAQGEGAGFMVEQLAGE